MGEWRLAAVLLIVCLAGGCGSAKDERASKGPTLEPAMASPEAPSGAGGGAARGVLESGAHVVRVFYATDRAPVIVDATEPGYWRLYVPAALAAAGGVLALLGAVLCARRVALGVTSAASLALAAWFGHSATIRAQQIERALSYDDRIYGSERHEVQGQPVLEVGVCEVSIPPDHRVGTVESPSVLRLEFREDPGRHVILQRVMRTPEDAFYAELRERIAGSHEQQALVFIHGYNVAFDDAVKRTGQIAYDLKFDGAVICYSWPSNGGLALYTQDEANVGWTVTQLEAFLTGLSERTGARTIHVIAHSMGNRALGQAMERMALRGPAGERFGQVILAAPDVDAGEFRSRYAAALTELSGRVTLYASSNDRALLASTKVHGYTRAGLSGEHLLALPGIETVDVSPIDTSLIGHSYYGDNPLMIQDLVALIDRDLPADHRTWLRQILLAAEATCWAFRREVAAETAIPRN